MLEQLQGHFSEAIKKLKGHGKITEDNVSDSMRDIRRALLEADVNLQVAKSFVAKVKEKALGEKVLSAISPGQQFTKLLYDELTSFLGDKFDSLTFDSSGKTVIVLAGLQGSGKTTTCAKLASFLKNKHNKNPLMVAADLQRPAAIEQLMTLGKSIDVDVYSDLKSKDPVKVVGDAMASAKKSKHDIILVDTAGRLHVDEELMGQLQEITNISKPHEILFVADGMSGQDATNSAKAFNETLELTGVILTRMDGDAKGGAALSIREVTSKPIKFIGVGEKIDALEKFHPDRIAGRILGMGDVVSLVEKAQDVADKKSIEELESKLADQSFTLEDFRKQLKQIQSMGPLSNMLDMIPGAQKLKGMKVDERRLKWVDAIICSMTPSERKNPEIIDGSRRKRIADGSGRNVQEVNSLLKQFKQMKSMMNKMGKNKKFKLPFMGL